MLSQPPANYGHTENRWRLRTLQQSCREWLAYASLSGLWGLLKRLQIHYKRGQLHLHSPDLDYVAKERAICERVTQVRAAPERLALLYLDEAGFYRQPTVAPLYAAQGRSQPCTDLSHFPNTQTRVLAALDLLDGRVHYCRRSHIRATTLAAFWQQLAAAYPHAETIYIVLDNWPVHFHPQSLRPLAAQTTPFAPHLPASWTQAQAAQAAQAGGLPIQLLPLPTYAPWLNPIEKLWRFLRQTVTHMHRLSNDWSALTSALDQALDCFGKGSSMLLHYTGLMPT